MKGFVSDVKNKESTIKCFENGTNAKIIRSCTITFIHLHKKRKHLANMQMNIYFSALFVANAGNFSDETTLLHLECVLMS